MAGAIEPMLLFSHDEIPWFGNGFDGRGWVGVRHPVSGTGN